MLESGHGKEALPPRRDARRHRRARPDEKCRHRSELDLLALIAGHSDGYLVRKVVDRAVCSACGDRNAEVSCTLGVANAPAYRCPTPIKSVAPCRLLG